jgi:tetratricopeptide (TPR) repeat protein
MRKLIVFGFAALFALSCASVPQKITTAEEYIKRGKEYETRSEYTLALLDYTHALDIDPYCIEAYINRGKVRRHKKDYDKALEDFNKAIEIDPECWDARIEKGYTYAAQENYDAAKNEYFNVLDNNPDYFGKVSVALGSLSIDRGDFAGAVTAYNLAISREPDNSEFRKYYAGALLIMGKPDQAIEQCEHALRINSDDWVTYFMLSMIYVNKKDYESASNILRDGIANLSSPAEKGFMYLSLAAVMSYMPYTNMEIDSLVNEIKQFISRERHEKPELLYFALMTLDMIKNDKYTGYEDGRPQFDASESDLDGIINELTAGIKEYPRNKYLYVIRALLYYGDDIKKAIRDYNKAISIDKNFAYAYLMRAVLAVVEKKYDQAITDCKKVIAMDPEFIVVAYNACGWAYIGKGNFGTAVEYFEKSLAVSQDSFETYYALGRVYEDQNNFEKAIEYYERALALGLNRQPVKTYKCLGGIYAKTGESEKAEAYFAEASYLDPDYEEADDGPDFSIPLSLWYAPL